MRKHLTVHDIDKAFQEIEMRNKKLFKEISKRKIKLKSSKKYTVTSQKSKNINKYHVNLQIFNKIIGTLLDLGNNIRLLSLYSTAPCIPPGLGMVHWSCWMTLGPAWLKRPQDSFKIASSWLS